MTRSQIPGKNSKEKKIVKYQYKKLIYYSSMEPGILQTFQNPDNNFMTETRFEFLHERKDPSSEERNT